ncbi:MAG: (deoxy)nucleoside triphosphate pyrophosphohydrolase [Treponemataceae bacterium]
MSCSIAGIAIKNSKILIAKRMPDGDMGGKWEFPGGKVEQGETCTDALIREFQEEFGIVITVGKELAKTQFTHNNNQFSLHAFQIFITDADDSFQLTEHTEFTWASFDQIKKLDFVDSDAQLFEDLQKCIG